MKNDNSKCKNVDVYLQLDFEFYTEILIFEL